GPTSPPRRRRRSPSVPAAPARASPRTPEMTTTPACSAGPTDAADLLTADARHVWHPYGAFPASTAPLPVASAEGVRLRLADGRELIDGIDRKRTRLNSSHVS